MKKVSLCLLIFMIIAGCKKDLGIERLISEQPSFKDSALAFLKAGLSEADFNSLDKASLEVLRYHKTVIGARILEKDSGNNFILIKKIPGGFSAERVGISGIFSGDHSGSILLQSLDKKAWTKFIVEKNKVIDISKSTGNTTPAKNSRDINQTTVLPEVVIVVQIYSISFDWLSLYWLFNQDFSYNLFYTNDEVSNYYFGNNQIIPDNVAVAPEINAPDHPVSVNEEIKCFTNNAGANYSITVNVNQAVPNSRAIFEPTAVYPVGHTFVTLEQHNPDGTSIIRSLGFYPRIAAKPGSAIDQSVFGDDSNTPFDVSLQIKVSGADMMSFLSNLSGQQFMNYDLNNFNCSNSPMSALSSINIHLPSTLSNEIFFSGNDPGDLGEDIRGLNLDNFSAANGGRQMIRTASNSNNLNPPAKHGGC